MNNNIAAFNKDGLTARTITDDNGEIWFVAKDIAQALGYNLNGGMSRIFGYVPDLWKGGKRIDTPGGEQETTCLTEQGLYFLDNSQ